MCGKLWMAAVLAVVLAACSSGDVAGPDTDSSTQNQTWVWQNPLPHALDYIGIETWGDGRAISLTTCEALHTTDGGNTWVQVDIENRRFIDLYRSGNVVSVFGNGFVYVSDDAGRSWRTRAIPVGFTGETAAFWDADHGIVVDDRGNIITTDDGGDSWTPRVSGTGDSLEDIEYLDSQTVFTGGEDGTLLRSLNGGATWSTLDNTDGTGDIHGIDATAGFVRFTDSDGRVFTSSDLGDSWFDAALSQSELNTVDFSDELNGIAAGNDRRIYKSSNGGVTWSMTAAVFGEVNAVSFTPGDGWVASDRGEIFRTTNSGADWDTKQSGFTGDLTAVSFADESVGMAVGGRCGLLLTEDGGQSWRGVLLIAGTNFCTGDFPQGVWMKDTESAVMVGMGGTIWTTSDRGASWARVSVRNAPDLYDVAFTNANVGIAVGEDGHLFTTDDGGTTWTQRGAGTTERLTSVSFASPNVVMIAGDNGVVHRSVNRGAVWTSARTDVPGINMTDIVMLDTETAFAVGNESGQTRIFKTTDGGDNWEEHLVTGNLKALAFDPDGRGYSAGSNGIIYSTEDNGATWEQLARAPRADLRAVFALDGGVVTVVGDNGAILRTTTGGR